MSPLTPLWKSPKQRERTLTSCPSMCLHGKAIDRQLSSSSSPGYRTEQASVQTDYIDKVSHNRKKEELGGLAEELGNIGRLTQRKCVVYSIYQRMQKNQLMKAGLSEQLIYLGLWAQLDFHSIVWFDWHFLKTTFSFFFHAVKMCALFRPPSIELIFFLSWLSQTQQVSHL